MGGEAVSGSASGRLIGGTVIGGAFTINWGNLVGEILDACE